MIIKNKGKYYLVQRELTEKEFEEHKKNLQRNYDTLDDRFNQKIAEIEKEKLDNKKKIKETLDNLKKI